MANNPYTDMRRLLNRLQELAQQMNLNVVNVSFSPDEDGIDRMMAIFEILPEAVKTAEEKLKEQTDEAFTDLVSGFEVLTDEEGNLIALEGPDTETEAKEKAELDELEQKRIDKENEAREKLKKWISGEDE